MSGTNAQDANLVLEKVMQAKLLREKRLQETDSELGSMPSIFLVRQASRNESTHGSRYVGLLAFYSICIWYMGRVLVFTRAYMLYKGEHQFQYVCVCVCMCMCVQLHFHFFLSDDRSPLLVHR